MVGMTDFFLKQEIYRKLCVFDENAMCIKCAPCKFLLQEMTSSTFGPIVFEIEVMDK
jgi:hypothetical protein